LDVDLYPQSRRTNWDRLKLTGGPFDGQWVRVHAGTGRVVMPSAGNRGLGYEYLILDKTTPGELDYTHPVIYNKEED